MSDHVDSLSRELRDLDEAVRAQTAGLVMLMRHIVQMQSMLKEVLAAVVAPEPDEPSPLVQLILKLNDSIEEQRPVLNRIEAAVVRQGGR